MIYDRGVEDAGRLTLNSDGTFTYRYWFGTVTTPDTGNCSISGTEWVHVSVRRWYDACSGRLEIFVNGIVCGTVCSVGWYFNPGVDIDVGDADIDILDFRYTDVKKSISSINNDRFSTNKEGWLEYWNFSSSDVAYGLDGSPTGGGAAYREISPSSDPRSL